MIIQNYDYSLKATRKYSASLTKTSGLKAMGAIKDENAKARKTNESSDSIMLYHKDIMDMHKRLLQNLFRNLFGEDSPVYQRYFGREQSISLTAGPAMTYTESTCFVESETTSFEGAARIETADGRSIDIAYTLNMSRTFAAYMETSRPANAILLDPLVVNLDSNMADIGDVHFFFDLDCDGKKEDIASLGASSGFLALDKNGDGTINDGSELFGALSGDGFAELAKYDLDSNGFIDESDDIYNRLKIWVAAGSDIPRLLSLKEAGIGAICLGNVDSQFSINDENNTTKAIVRKTGFFLYEEGSAGSIQQLDFTSVR